ncbi:hypothetical protein [Sodalis-like endosymbiont of Proechinophthirus fluctus]|uniref:hypothetical protein n=1 Tax=Sodalis-like endosymbiont of Proechinophthirus fluctus TaxID=1462730 RepID=UPI00083672E4
MLEQQGFCTEGSIAGIPIFTWSGKPAGQPNHCNMGEYDALPGLNQQADVAEPHPVTAGVNGHGCGYNLLGSTALQATS